MAISLVASVSTDAASGNPAITHGLTFLSGDVVIATINANGASNTVTDNNGATSLTSRDFIENPDSARYYVFDRVCTGSEPATLNFTLGTSARWSVVIRQYRGVDSSIWDVAPSVTTANTGSGDLTGELASITTATNGAVALALLSDDFNPTVTTFSSIDNGFGNVLSEAGQQFQTTADKTITTAGAVGITTVTCTTSATITWGGWLCALKPASETDPNIDTVRNPEYVGSGAQTVTVTIGATLSPALHASTTAGDLLVMIIAGRPNGSTITNTFSNTWTLAGERFREIGAGATDLYIGVYYRYAQPGETAPTVTPDADFLTSSTTGGVSAQIATYRYTSNVLDVAAAVGDSAAAATWTPPAVTTGTANCMVISCVATADDNALNHNTANSFTLAMSGAGYDTTTGSDHAVGMSYLLKTTAGAVTMNIWNESAVGNDAWVGVTVAFRRKTSMPVYKRPTLFWKRRK